MRRPATPQHGGADEAGALAGTARLVLDLRLACLAAAMLVVSQQQHPLHDSALLALALPVSLLPLLAWPRVAPALLQRPVLVLLDGLVAAALLVLVPGDALQVLAGATVFLAALVRGGPGGLVSLGCVVAAQVLLVTRGDALAVEAWAHTAVLAALAWVALHLRQLLVDRAALRGEVERARVAAARQGERARLARDLHDSLASTLHGVHLLARSLEGRLRAGGGAAGGVDLSGAADRAAEIAEAAGRARGEARTLVADLREETPSDLLAALDDVVAAAAVRGVRVRVSSDAPFALAVAAVHELSSALAELVENAVRHGGGSDVDVALDLVRAGAGGGSGGGSGALRCAVTDRGPGIPVPLDLVALQRQGRFGVVGVHERLAALGGAVAVERPSGGGTRVVLTVPLGPPAQRPGRAELPRPRWARRQGAPRAVAS